MTFEALESGTFTLTIPAAVDSTCMTSISYSLDDGDNWTTTNVDSTAQTITTPTVAQGDTVLWKGEGNKLSTTVGTISKFSSTGNYNVSGNAMSLLYGDNFENQTTLNQQYCFAGLFYQSRTLVSAENLVLPSTTLTLGCYLQMFCDCSVLTTPPKELTATTMSYNCYDSMFSGCVSLTTLPELKATTLSKYCYQSMFSGCTSLTTIPSNYLQATTLSQYCYNGMFYGCTSLTTAPELPATTLSNYCYQQMFYGCRNLNSVKILATSVSALNCLNNWLQNTAATGTVICEMNPDTNLPYLPLNSASGIPSGWTVVDA